MNLYSDFAHPVINRSKILCLCFILLSIIEVTEIRLFQYFFTASEYSVVLRVFYSPSQTHRLFYCGNVNFISFAEFFYTPSLLNVLTLHVSIE